MERRNFLASALGAGTLAAVATTPARASSSRATAPADGAADRRYMLDLLAKMANPVLAPMSQGKLQAVFKPELSPTWTGAIRRSPISNASAG
jgi:hypothetical protein